MHFVRATLSNLARLEQALEQSETSLKDSFKKDIQKIENISLLSPEEVIVGFEDNWEKGKVEMVLHPFEDETTIAIEKFKKILLDNGVPTESLRIKSYYNGPTFISGNLNENTLKAIKDFNPLRTAHPLKITPFL
jgi:hypothetical protein